MGNKGWLEFLKRERQVKCLIEQEHEQEGSGNYRRTRMLPKMGRLLKAELIVLLCILMVKAADVQTNFVSAGTAGILQQAAQIAPNSEAVHDALGDAHYVLDQIDKGDEAFEQAHIVACEKNVAVSNEVISEDSHDSRTYSDMGEAYDDSNYLVVSARYNRTYADVTRISFHEKSSDYYARRIRTTLS